jgi:hypothetical protein
MACSLFLLGLGALGAPASPDSASAPIAPVPPQANLRVATVQIRVAPDRADWTYHVGETARFRARARAGG